MNKKGAILGGVIGVMLGVLPIFIGVCGNVDEGFCFDFMTWPARLMDSVFTMGTTNYNPSSTYLVFLLIITPAIFALVGGIIGFLIAKLLHPKHDLNRRT